MLSLLFGKTNNMQKQHKGIFRIGTSGIVVPVSKQSFPNDFRDKSRLNYYGSLFNTLEVNSTFQSYRCCQPSKSGLLRFPRFSIHHKAVERNNSYKTIKIDFENIDIFFNAVQHIGEKKGCLLIQFPGSITSEYRNKVTQILSRLQRLDFGQQWRKAVEFRSADWYNSETTFLLAKYDVSMVFHDMPKSNNLALSEGEKFVYLRYHGKFEGRLQRQL